MHNDRVIRLWRLKTPANRRSDEEEDESCSVTIMHEFHDVVGRTPWKKVCFSGDGELIVGGMWIWNFHANCTFITFL